MFLIFECLYSFWNVAFNFDSSNIWKLMLKIYNDYFVFMKKNMSNDWYFE